MNIITTTCPMDCPDTCALEIGVENGRIASIKGSHDHPNTAGFICSKIGSFAKRVYHDDRLLYPMRRAGAKGAGGFTRVSWEDATAEITERFREISNEWGAEAILPYHYGGSNGFISDGLLDELYFQKLGASRLGRTLCAATSGAAAMALYGKMPTVAFEDFVHAKVIIIWGGNPKASNIHLVPFLRQAKRNGAFLAVIDPVRNFSSNEIDLHLPVFPGADLPVALAMIRLWHERGRLDQHFTRQHVDGLETLLERAAEWPVERAAIAARVRADDIRKLADVYASDTPALIRIGWGIERSRNGGQAIAAVLAIPALLGKFGVRGGGYALSNGAAAQLDKQKLLGRLNWTTREINMTQLGEVLNSTTLAPPIRGLFVYNCNAAVTAPHQEAVLRGLAREDLFTVVSDQVMTDTAKYADIVLPATTFLEHRDVRRAYGAYVAGGTVPAIAPRGEAIPNEMLFAALGRAMGWRDEPFTWSSATCMLKVAEALSLAGKAVDASVIEAGKCARYDFPGQAPVQFQNVFPVTSNRKIQLASPILGPKPYIFDPIESEFPLALVSSSNSKMITSTLGEFNYPELRASLNPQDAAKRGIADGDVVRVFNDLGEVVCRAQITSRMRVGVVLIPKGAWQKSSMNGRTATALCPATINVMGGGACYNDARVEVERADAVV